MAAGKLSVKINACTIRARHPHWPRPPRSETDAATKSVEPQPRSSTRLGSGVRERLLIRSARYRHEDVTLLQAPKWRIAWSMLQRSRRPRRPSYRRLSGFHFTGCERTRRVAPVARAAARVTVWRFVSRKRDRGCRQKAWWSAPMTSRTSGRANE